MYEQIAHAWYRLAALTAKGLTSQLMRIQGYHDHLGNGRGTGDGMRSPRFEGAACSRRAGECRGGECYDR